MALTVGDLRYDLSASSFISLEGADAYLEPEGNAAWAAATTQQKEAALVRASRWMAETLTWTAVRWTDADLVQVGRAAARLAVEALSRDLYAVEDVSGAVKSESVGSVAVVYQDARGADAAGVRFPWLKPMLRGLVLGGSRVGVVRV